ncbi:MAG TPA: AraC family transcriptional regulator [Giesbergeria sp.]|nr:AraC family transcriptional regulator [Giesbergeria sp.]
MTDHPKIDRLAALLQRFPLRTQLLHARTLTGPWSADEQRQGGTLHLFQEGAVQLRQGMHGAPLSITEPCVVYLPRAQSHQLDPQDGQPVNLISLSVDLGASDDNPLLRALPPLLLLPLSQVPQCAPTLHLLFAESTAARCGHGAVLERLAEALVIQVLRVSIEHQWVDSGLLCGLSDPRLARTLAALHGAPEQAWTLPRMAGLAHMSRARFAEHFTRVMGESPGSYLAAWRIGWARTLLNQGRPLKQVADAVGYASASAFTRAFTRHTGASPSHWLARQATDAAVLRPSQNAPAAAPGPLCH